MSTSLGPKSAASNSGSWTSGSNAYANGGGNASVATVATSHNFGSYDFSALPSTGTLTIAGIAVRLDAWYPILGGDPADAATLTVDLSWDNGTTWTSTKVTATLVETETTYTLGGSSDTWGRTWTRSELQSGSLLVRVKTSGSFVMGGDTWHLDYVPVTVYYTNRLEADGSASGTGSASGVAASVVCSVGSSSGSATASADAASVEGSAGSGAGVGGGGGVGASVVNLSFNESVQAQDGPGGTAAGSSLVIGGPGREEITGGGPDFTAASVQGVMRETIGVQLVVLKFAGGASVFQWADAIAVDSVDAVLGNYTPGVLDWGDLVIEGVFGAQAETTNVVVRLRNTTAGDLLGAPIHPGDSMQVADWIGGSVRVNVFVEDGGVWYTKLLFIGKVEDVTLGEEYIQIRAFQESSEDLVVPTLSVDEELFTWGDKEGKRPVPMGAPIPLCIGRFGLSALYELPAGHPLAWDNSVESHDGSTFFSTDLRKYLHGLYYAAALGIKVPMLLAPLGADMSRGLSTTPTADLEKVPQAVFVHGLKGTAPEIGMSLGANPSYRYLCEYADDANAIMPSANLLQHIHACTWDQESGRGLVFARDMSWDMPPLLLPGNIQNPLSKKYGGAGEMQIVRPGDLSATGRARFHHAFYINRTQPDWGTSEVLKWGGALQCAAISMDGLSRIRRTTDSAAYGTTAGVVNPLNALDVNPGNYAEVPAGEVLSLQAPDSATDQGEIYAVQLCILLDPSSTATLCTLRARWSYSHLMKLYVNRDGSESGNAVTFNPGSAGVKQFFVMSRNPAPFIQQVANPPSAIGFIAQWKFTHWAVDLVAGGANYVPYPMDVHITGTGGHVRVVHVWLEVFYRAKPPEPNIQRVETPTRLRVKLHTDGGSRTVLHSQFREKDSDPGRSPAQIALLGTGPRDSGGRYTGNGGAIIENPADVVGLLVDRFLGGSVFSNRAQGNAFGGFGRARTALNALVPGTAAYSGWKLSLAITERTTLRDLFQRISVQSCSMVQQQLDETVGGPQWRMFVDDPDPATNAPERMYRTDGFYFGPNHMRPGSLAVSLTDRSTLASDFLLEYGLHAFTGEFSYSKHVRPGSNDFATNGAAYMNACATAGTRYGVARKLTFQAPDVWNHATAEALLKWHVDSFRERRVLVEFETFVNGVDLQPGHVIRFSDDLGAVVPYPGVVSGATWSTHEFNVQNVQIMKDSGDAVRVRVAALECYVRAA